MLPNNPATLNPLFGQHLGRLQNRALASRQRLVAEKRSRHAHHPEPFYRTARKGWFVQIGKRQVPLGRDPSPKPDRKTGKPIAPASALSAYHEIMSDHEEPQPAPVVDATYAVVIIDQFLGWVERHKYERTHEWYQRHCQMFAKSIPRDLTIPRLKPLHLTNLCDAHADWSPTTKHGIVPVRCRGRSGGPSGRG